MEATDVVAYFDQFVAAIKLLLRPDALVSTGALTALAGFVGSLAWSGANALLRWFQSWRLRTVRRYSVALAKARLPFDAALIAPRCLVVRYGVDSYVRDMASDKEREECKLQNRTIKIPLSHNSDDSTSFDLRLPIHKRLGTQFKCFVDVANGQAVGSVVEFLSNCPSIVSPERSSSPLHEHRIFFLLRDFAVRDTVDGFKNNMCYPD
ncbi:MAG: hypothetical protein Q8L49_16815 [Burkholderiaceae bacterium]|nr:hypothetical protein [Burkholderiaceae bacterium]